jgi:transcriptional regulator with XRE-family HTH domain
MTEKEIGDAFRALREKRGLRQADLSLAPGLDQAAVSRFERGEELGRFVKHAALLVERLGPKVWRLAYAALAYVHGPDDWRGLAPAAKALTEALADLTEEGRDVTGRQERPVWRVRKLPTLEELAKKLGHPGKLTLQEELHLAALIQLVGLPVGEIPTEAERSRKAKALRAELAELEGPSPSSVGRASRRPGDAGRKPR